MIKLKAQRSHLSRTDVKVLEGLFQNVIATDMRAPASSTKSCSTTTDTRAVEFVSTVFTTQWAQTVKFVAKASIVIAASPTILLTPAKVTRCRRGNHVQVDNFVIQNSFQRLLTRYLCGKVRKIS